LCVNESLEKLLEIRKFPLNSLDISKQMNEASFLFIRLLSACSDCKAQDCTCMSNNKMIESLSLIWSYVCTSVDIALAKQAADI